MNNEKRSWYERVDPHINQFYKLLRQRKLDRARQVVAQLEQMEDRTYAPWAEYFSGILAEEQERNWAEAESRYQCLLETEIDPVLRAHILLSLGVAYNNQARWAESVQACEKSAAIWQDLGYRFKRAYVLRQIAFSLEYGYRMGQFGADVLDQAITHCEEALNTFESYDASQPEIVLYEPDIPQYQSLVLSTLGNALSDSGQWKQATACFRYMLELCNQRNDHYLKAFALQGLGGAYQMRGTVPTEQVHALFRESLELFEKAQDFFKAISVHAQQGRLYQSTGDLHAAIRCYDCALTLVEQVRAGVTSERARMGFAETVTYVYANIVLALQAVGDDVQAFDYVEKARSRTFLEMLTHEPQQPLQQFIAKTITLAEIQRDMPEDCILLEYFTTGLLEDHGRRISQNLANNTTLFPQPHTLLFVVTKHSVELHPIELSPNDLIPSELERAVEDYFLEPTMRKILYQYLVAPASDMLGDKRRIYIVPHGPLHYVPFQALIAPDESTLLCDAGPEVVYAPSASILFRQPPNRMHSTRDTCLSIGYNGAGEQQLRFAEEEAAFIAKVTGGDLLAGPHPKKAELYRRGPSYQILHFSCHGEFDPESPMESLLHISPDETLTAQEIIEHLRLNCNIVMLSACDSGLSRVRPGDELYGLSRAFMYAGTPAIIASLWAVDERSTLLFAQHFYEQVQTGAEYATALKASQLYLKNLTRSQVISLLSEHQIVQSAQNHAAYTELFPGTHGDERIFADPKYWAPFILIGDPNLLMGT